MKKYFSILCVLSLSFMQLTHTMEEEETGSLASDHAQSLKELCLNYIAQPKDLDPSTAGQFHNRTIQELVHGQLGPDLPLDILSKLPQNVIDTHAQSLAQAVQGDIIPTDVKQMIIKRLPTTIVDKCLTDVALDHHTHPVLQHEIISNLSDEYSNQIKDQLVKLANDKETSVLVKCSVIEKIPELHKMENIKLVAEQGAITPGLAQMAAKLFHLHHINQFHNKELYCGSMVDHGNSKLFAQAHMQAFFDKMQEKGESRMLNSIGVFTVTVKKRQLTEEEKAELKQLIQEAPDYCATIREYEGERQQVIIDSEENIVATLKNYTGLLWDPAAAAMSSDGKFIATQISGGQTMNGLQQTGFDRYFLILDTTHNQEKIIKINMPRDATGNWNWETRKIIFSPDNKLLIIEDPSGEISAYELPQAYLNRDLTLEQILNLRNFYNFFDKLDWNPVLDMLCIDPDEPNHMQRFLAYLAATPNSLLFLINKFAQLRILLEIVHNVDSIENLPENLLTKKFKEKIEEAKLEKLNNNHLAYEHMLSQLEALTTIPEEHQEHYNVLKAYLGAIKFICLKAILYKLPGAQATEEK